jgi:hypothetical protein
MDDATRRDIQESARIAAEEAQRVAQENASKNLRLAAKTGFKIFGTLILGSLAVFIVVMIVIFKTMFR